MVIATFGALIVWTARATWSGAPLTLVTYLL
jgi:hypothetical protein